MSAGRASSDTAMVVRKGLQALARRRGVEFQRVLSEFAIERLLFRLGQSRYRKDFVLKGATLFRLWAGNERRATWDLDLLGSGESGVEAVVAMLRDICSLSGEDGIAFDLDAIRGEEIRHPDD